MYFTTEMIISMQTSRDEDVYMTKLYEAISNIIPAECRTTGKLFTLNYTSLRKHCNQIDIHWKDLDDSKVASIESAIKHNKWLRNHNCNHLCTVYI